MSGPTFTPDMRAAPAAALDASTFDAASPGLRAMMATMTTLWLAMMALGFGTVEESMRRAFGG
jgi:hypothetical protein